MAEQFLVDVRHALRLWARNPAFSAIAVITVALGIGASTAIVGQINAVFWKPLPVAHPSDLRILAWTSPRRSFVLGPNVFAGPTVNGTETLGTFSYSAYVAMRDGARAHADLACWADLGEARPVVLGELGFGVVQFVSGNYFRALGVQAALGRTLQPEDDVPGAFAPVAVVSHAFWRRVFGQRDEVIRQTLQLNGQPFAIVGVMPEGFYGMDASVTPDVVVPVNAIQIAAATSSPLANPGLWNVCRTVARLAPGIADGEASRVFEQWAADAIAAKPPPTAYDPPRIVLIDGSRGLSTLRDAASVPLLVMLGVVCGLLLAACANIAGLLIARGSARERELATRLALGAPRSRVVRQLITESLVLSIAGGALGLVMAYVLSRVAPKFLSQFMPTLFGADRSLSVSTGMDMVVFLYGATAAVVAGLLFGIVPAVRVSRVELIATIRQATAGTTRRIFGFTTGHAMVMAQTALAMLLLVSAGLLSRTVANLRGTDLGFSGDGLLYARIEPRVGRVPVDQRNAFFENAVKRLQSLPGVVSAGAASSPPIGGLTSVGIGSESLPVCHGTAAAPDAVPFTVMTPGFFDTLGVRFIAGRDFTWSEQQTTRSVIVNEAFVSKYVGGQNPIGRAVRVSFDCSGTVTELPIQGVVSTVRSGLRIGSAPNVYAPLRSYLGTTTLMVRTTGDAAAMIPSVRRAMTDLNPNVPTFSEATFGDLRERQLRRELLLSDLVTVFGTVTLVICCLGIYGLLSYSVARRRPEISVRMAIGASTASIVQLIVRESLVPVALGIVAGSLGAMALTRRVDDLLFGVSSRDPLVIAGAAVIFLIVAALAAALPARTAARVDPLLALRQ